MSGSPTRGSTSCGPSSHTYSFDHIECLEGWTLHISEMEPVTETPPAASRAFTPHNAGCSQRSRSLNLDRAPAVSRPLIPHDNFTNPRPRSGSTSPRLDY